MAQDFVKKKLNTPPKSNYSSTSARQRKLAVKTRVGVGKKKTDKRKTNVRKPHTPKKAAPFWLWVFISISVVGFGFFLAQISSSDRKENYSKTEITQSNTEKKLANKKDGSQVKFDFYEILKDKEVNVDARAIEKTPEKKNIIYFLQAGSFKKPSDADALRAKLLLQGLPVSIEKTTNKNGQEWHRVVVGSFNTRSKLAKARGVLASNEINSIVLKR